MPTTTITEVLTYGDYCTLPGGIALRDRGADHTDSRFIVQKFTTDRATGTARSYFRTNYAKTLAEGFAMLAEDVEAASRYDTGGSLNLSGRFEADNPAWPDYAKGGARDPDAAEVAA